MTAIFTELYKHGRLAARRHPMYERNKIAKILGYVMAAVWACYLIRTGVKLALELENTLPNREAYYITNLILWGAILFLDFLLRFPLQRMPTQEIKPYLLLPVKRKTIINFLLLRSGLSVFNLIWLFFFVPFACLAFPSLFGIQGTVFYFIGVYLLIIANNYWCLLCRTLINERIWWAALPLVVYAAAVSFAFLFHSSPFFKSIGGGYLEGNILHFLTTILAIAALWGINHKLISSLTYKETAATGDSKIKRVSEYRFLERFGEIGEYMRLELKMVARNKNCKAQFRSLFLMVVMFSLMLSFSSIYDSGVLYVMICAYNFSAFGPLILSRVMSYEGNYLDGLMVRQASIAALLKAKYYTYSIGEVLLFLLMLPAVITGKLSLLGAFAWFFYTIGFTYFCAFQLVVSNRQTLPLNEKVTSRQSNNGTLIVVNLLMIGVPMLLYTALNELRGETFAYLVMLTIGIGFTLTSPLWIRNVYQRFMKRRYRNMEGFRDSRQ